jgi:hypothetical protein
MVEDAFQLSVDVLFPPPKTPATRAAQAALSALAEARNHNRFRPLYAEPKAPGSTERKPSIGSSSSTTTTTTNSAPVVSVPEAAAAATDHAVAEAPARATRTARPRVAAEPSANGDASASEPSREPSTEGSSRGERRGADETAVRVPRFTMKSMQHRRAPKPAKQEAREKAKEVHWQPATDLGINIDDI